MLHSRAWVTEPPPKQKWEREKEKKGGGGGGEETKQIEIKLFSTARIN